MTTYFEQAQQFGNAQPYHSLPYSSRNWGGRWHSLCSYHGKLKPSIAHFLISEFTKPGESVLDPLCGVGTIPFEACRQGRLGIGNDLSPLAFCVTKAKIESPKLASIKHEIPKLEKHIDDNLSNLNMDNLPYSDFGFNRTLGEYFHPSTFAEIILARDYFANKHERLNSGQAFVMACILHILHGNRPYALSRTSHPLTPYAPKGPYEYKNLIEQTWKKVNLVFEEDLGRDFIKGKTYFGDYSEINQHDIDSIITSPPFAGSMKFFTQNWMRLWFSGWEPQDFKNANQNFLDAKQLNNIEVYDDFFAKCHAMLKPKGRLILHLGRNNKMNMAKALIPIANRYFDLIYLFTENVSGIEKHGLKDKGGTTDHQFIFLENKSS